MAVPWQVVGVVAAGLLGLVAAGINVLKMPRPAFNGSRAWFWAAAAWMTACGALLYLPNISKPNAFIFALFEVAVGFVLIRGLKWIHALEEAAPAPTLRNKTLRLAEEIGQFVVMCRATRPKGAMIPYDEGAPWILVAASAQAAYVRETGKLFYERFATRVMDLREELSQAGIVDDQLDAVYLNPASDDDMATVGQRFRALAERLPAA